MEAFYTVARHMSRFLPAKTSHCFRKGKTLTGNKLAVYFDFQFYFTFI